MTALLVVALIEVPVVAGVSLYVAHRMLRSHAEVMATVIGHRAREVGEALSGAEKRLSQAAHAGLLARHGPARLKD